MWSIGAISVAVYRQNDDEIAVWFRLYSQKTFEKITFVDLRQSKSSKCLNFRLVDLFRKSGSDFECMQLWCTLLGVHGRALRHLRLGLIAKSGSFWHEVHKRLKRRQGSFHVPILAAMRSGVSNMHKAQFSSFFIKTSLRSP